MDRRVNGTLTFGSSAGSLGATQYQGAFSNDLFHGSGKLTLTDGTIYEGVFESG